MKKSMLMLLSVILLTALSIKTSFAADDKKPEPIKKILVDNEFVTVYHATFPPGAVAVWHSHPNHTAYALDDITMLVEEQGKPSQTVEVKAGEAMYMPAVTHQTTNTGSKPFSVVVTEIKFAPHKH